MATKSQDEYQPYCLLAVQQTSQAALGTALPPCQYFSSTLNMWHLMLQQLSALPAKMTSQEGYLTQWLRCADLPGSSTLNTRHLLSQQPVATRVPSGCQATHTTEDSCFRRISLAAHQWLSPS